MQYYFLQCKISTIWLYFLEINHEFARTKNLIKTIKFKTWSKIREHCRIDLFLKPPFVPCVCEMKLTLQSEEQASKQEAEAAIKTDSYSLHTVHVGLHLWRKGGRMCRLSSLCLFTVFSVPTWSCLLLTPKGGTLLVHKQSEATGRREVKDSWTSAWMK